MYSKTFKIMMNLMNCLSSFDRDFQLGLLIKSKASLLKLSAFSRSLSSPDLSTSSTSLKIEDVEVVDVEVLEVVVVVVVISFLFPLC